MATYSRRCGAPTIPRSISRDRYTDRHHDHGTGCLVDDHSVVRALDGRAADSQVNGGMNQHNSQDNPPRPEPQPTNVRASRGRLGEEAEATTANIFEYCFSCVTAVLASMRIGDCEVLCTVHVLSGYGHRNDSASTSALTGRAKARKAARALGNTMGAASQPAPIVKAIAV